MTIQIIPTFDVPSWSQSTTLEGQTFQLSFAFNQREACWYLSVADNSGVDIYNGMKLMCLQFLMRKCRDPRRPAGDFAVFDNTAANTPPGLEDLLANSGRCTLVYLTSDVLATLAAPGGLAALLATLQSSPTSTASTYGSQ